MEKLTAMQDLRNDLLKSIETSEVALQEINNLETRAACVNAVEITLNTIIKRIDDELLQLEKEQIVKAVDDALEDRSLYESFQTLKSGEQYFNETFTTQHSESLNKLKEQLEKWISDCEIQAEKFVKDNHEVSYLSSKAMAQAYRNALELINPKP